MISSQGIMSRYECSGCSRDGPIAAAQVREIWVGNTGGGQGEPGRSFSFQKQNSGKLDVLLLRFFAIFQFFVGILKMLISNI